MLRTPKPVAENNHRLTAPHPSTGGVTLGFNNNGVNTLSKV
nr:MAG TPA: hypothetical protein [Caudoviricetes sp.]